MNRGRHTAALSAALVALAASGCHAQMKGNAELGAAEHDDRRWEPIDPAASNAPQDTDRAAEGASSAATHLGARSAPAAPDVPPAQPAGATAGPSGVARDLSLSPSASRTAVCRCLAVAYGPANDARFAWQGSEPRPVADAVAIAIDGAPCGARRARPPRASISGVGREGNDVVLTVETVREGTPVMRGAVVPHPAPGSQLIVRGRGGAPYGRSATEAGPCRLPLL